MRGLTDRHGGILRDGQRRHREDLLALDIEHVPTGRQHAKAGRIGEQLAHHDRAGSSQVLAAVEHDKQLLLLQVISQVCQGVSGHVTQVERGRDRVRQQLRVAQRRELDEPCPVGKRTLHLLGCPQREPGLAGTSHAGERQQPTAGQQAADLCQLLAPSDEAGQLRGQCAVRFRLHFHCPSFMPGRTRRGTASLGACVPTTRLSMAVKNRAQRQQRTRPSVVARCLLSAGIVHCPFRVGDGSGAG